MRTPENPENPCCHAQAFIGTPPPQSPFPPPPTPQTTRCSGGKACSGHEGWAGRGGGAPVQPREAQAVQLRESASKGSPCSGVLRGKNSMLWCERGWNTWAFLQLDSVSNLVSNRWKHIPEVHIYCFGPWIVLCGIFGTVMYSTPHMQYILSTLFNHLSLQVSVKHWQTP